MNKLGRSLCRLLLAALALLLLALAPTDVPAQTSKNEMNAWTVGLAGGQLEGAPIRLAAEMARVVDDGPNLHVLPIITRGATENLNSLLYLRGVDAAIINSDALEEYKNPDSRDPPPDCLPSQSVPLGVACLRSAGDFEPGGFGR